MLKELLPWYYENSPETLAIEDALDAEAQALAAAALDAQNQVFVRTCDSGIELWEKLLALEPRGQLEDRKAAVLFVLRQKGTLTLKTLKNLLLAYADEVKIDEGTGGNVVAISLYQLKETPTPDRSPMDDIAAKLYAIRPAHLSFALESIQRADVSPTLTLRARLASHRCVALAPLAIDWRTASTLCLAARIIPVSARSLPALQEEE